MKKVKFLALSALLLSTFTFQSCKDDDDNNNVAPEIPSAKKVFILNEGSWQKNNSSLDIYYPDGEKSYQSDVYSAQNGEKVGDTGQDLLYYGGKVYMSVFGSSYLAKMDSTGKVLQKYSFTATDGQPRYLAAKDGFLYVSTYSGRVAKFDTASIAAPAGFVEVGPHPEEMCVKDNNLYVVISGDYNVKYENKIAVVDLSSFTFKENIEILDDPTNILSFKDKLYVVYYSDPMAGTQAIIEVDPSSKSYKAMADGSKLATDGTNLYYIHSATDWSDYSNVKTVSTFHKYGSSDNFLDLTSTPELSSSIVYLFDIDPDNGDFYIGTSDTQTSGIVYRFDKTGKYITKFETSGLNPNHAVFVK